MKKRFLAIFLAAVLTGTSVSPTFAAEFSSGEETVALEVAEEPATEVSIEEEPVSEAEIENVLQENSEELEMFDDTNPEPMEEVIPDVETFTEESFTEETETPVGDAELSVEELPDVVPETQLSTEEIFGSEEFFEFSDGEGTLDTSNLTCVFDETTGTLTVSGKGAMTDYGTSDELAPWYGYMHLAKKLVVNEGVTNIGSFAFYGFNVLESVTLPKSVVSIDASAFRDCTALNEVNLSEGLRVINEYAFQGTAITTLALPATLMGFDPQCVMYCKNLQSVTAADESTILQSVNGVLFNKDQTTLIYYPEGKTAGSYTIPQTVKNIGPYSFCSAKLSQILIPEGVTGINAGAFYMSDITSLKIPNSVTHVESWICYTCDNLLSVEIGTGVTALSYQMFENCYSLKTVKLGKNVVDLNSLAFSYCTSLQEITIPKGVKVIENGTFGECTSLKKVNLPSTLEEIGYQAFVNCSSLTEITIPKGVHTINSYAFYGTSIAKVTLPSTVTTISEHAFPGNTVITNENTDLDEQEDGSYIMTYNVPVKVSYDYTSAFEVLDLVNQQRTKAGLNALTMDQDLLRVAMLRAAELSIYFSHNRPNGKEFTSASKKIDAENVASGQANATKAMNAWMNSTSHKAHILTDGFVSMGVGAVVVDGTTYWVQLFGSEDLTAADASQYKNGTDTAQIKIALPEANTFSIAAAGTQTLDIGQKGTASLYFNNMWVETDIETAHLAFSSSDPKICTVSADGVTQGIETGKATITVSLKNTKKVYGTFDVQVSSKISADLVLAEPKLKSAESAGYNSVTVTWEEVPFAKTYTLFYKGGSVKKWKVVKTGITGTSYTHVSSKKKPLTAGTTYTYTVRAIRSTLKSAYGTNSLQAKPLPATVKLTSVTSEAYNKLKITWEEVPGATGYFVYQKLNGKWKRIANVKSAKTFYVHTNSNAYPVLTGVENTYTVKAYRTVEKKKISGAYDTTGISGKSKLSRPSITAITKIKKGFKIKWQKVEGAAGYLVQRYDNGKWVTKKTIKKGGKVTYYDKTAKQGVKYKYRVAAYTTVNGENIRSTYSKTKSRTR